MALLVSLKAFLNTGHLGPLRPGLTMNEVGKLLGPPRSWIVSPDVTAPGYWIYEKFLEISFLSEPHLHCTWFQLEYSSGLKGDVEVLGKDFVLSLDGLNGESGIADSIAAIDDIERVAVRFLDYETSTTIQVRVEGAVQLTFCADDLFEQATADPSALARFANEKCRLIDIYSYTYDEFWTEEFRSRVLAYENPVGELRMSGRQFLGHVAAGERD